LLIINIDYKQVEEETKKFIYNLSEPSQPVESRYVSGRMIGILATVNIYIYHIRKKVINLEENFWKGRFNYAGIKIRK